MEKITFTTEDGGEDQIPARYEVCDRCRGTGTHVNPSVDGHGISPEEFAEDPDFEESYFSGVYDVVCSECNGLRVTLVADEDRADPALLAEYHKYLERQWGYEREREHERRMGY